MNYYVGKRGLSPVIASVLLILFVVVLAVMIFMWGRGFIGEQTEKFGEPIEGYCDSVDFTAVFFDGSPDDHVEIVNRGNVGIGAFDFKLVYFDGNSQVIRGEEGVPVLDQVNIPVLAGTVDFSSIASIEIFPVLKGDVINGFGGELVCDDPVFLEGEW